MPNRGDSQALLLVDVINHFEFPDSDKLRKQALLVAPKIARLKQRARQKGLPIIYVNDNFGQWQSNFAELLAYCRRPQAPGAKFVERILPDEHDYLLLKPMHSAFYQSPLETLLRQLGCTSIILAGLATNSCILCTAHDAHMRELGVTVAADCCAARTRSEHNRALEHLRAIGGIGVVPLSKVKLAGSS